MSEHNIPTIRRKPFFILEGHAGIQEIFINFINASYEGDLYLTMISPSHDDMDNLRRSGLAPICGFSYNFYESDNICIRAGAGFSTVIATGCKFKISRFAPDSPHSLIITYNNFPDDHLLAHLDSEPGPSEDPNANPVPCIFDTIEFDFSGEHIIVGNEWDKFIYVASSNMVMRNGHIFNESEDEIFIKKEPANHWGQRHPFLNP